MVGNDNYIGVDYASTLSPSGVGRDSVRIEGTKNYNKGLFVVDIKHMPGGICGTWPAFWSLGMFPFAKASVYTSMALALTECHTDSLKGTGEWPKGGEIDIIEGVNKNNGNKYVLHTDTQCKVNGLGQSGAQASYDCALDGPATTSGCDVNTNGGVADFGESFNSNNGGVYAMEWTSEHIKMWFFPRGSIPASIVADKPDVKDFGTPTANFKGACDMDTRFKNHRFIFDTTFCGDWAGNVYAQSSCQKYPGLDGMASCKKFVAENPSAFKDAYWLIKSFKTYTRDTSVASLSSTRSSSTRLSTSSSSTRSSTSSSSTHSSTSSTRSSTASSSTRSSNSSTRSSTASSTRSSTSSSTQSSTTSSSTQSSTTSSSTLSSSGSSASGHSLASTLSSSSSTSSHASASSSHISSSPSTAVSASASYGSDSATSTPCTTSTPVGYSYTSSSPIVYGDEYLSSPLPEAYEYEHLSSSPAGYVSGSSTSTPCSTSTPIAYGYPSASSPAAYEYTSSQTPISYASATSTPYKYYSESSSTPSYDTEPSTPVAYHHYSSVTSESTSCTTSTPAPYLPTPYSLTTSDMVTATYTHTYVDICSTGYTTKTTTQTMEYHSEATAQVSSLVYPPGLTVTTKVCTACAVTPVTVTLTVPRETTATYPVKTSDYSLPPAGETLLQYTYCTTCSNLTPSSSPTPPSYNHGTMIHKSFPPTPTPWATPYTADDYTMSQTSTLYLSKISTVYLVPSEAPSPSHYKPVEVPSCVGEGCMPTSPAAPVPYPTPKCSGAGCTYEDASVTVEYGTGTATGSGYTPSKTSAYNLPYFTGAATSYKAGGAVVGGVAAVVVAFL
jgi:hypothetical protein